LGRADIAEVDKPLSTISVDANMNAQGSPLGHLSFITAGSRWEWRRYVDRQSFPQRVFKLPGMNGRPENRQIALSNPADWVEQFGDNLFRSARKWIGGRHAAEDLVWEKWVPILGPSGRATQIQVTSPVIQSVECEYGPMKFPEFVGRLYRHVS
jgi:hypothetical protein